MIEPINFLFEFKRYRQYLFESHAKYLLIRFLNPWIEKVITSNIIKNSNLSNEYTSLIVDDRPNEILRFSVLNTLLMTRLRLPVNIYTTKKSFIETKNLFSDILNNTNLIKIIALETDKINISYYNDLFKSSTFWSNLVFRKVLVFQTDSLLIEPMEFSMFNYDYIGALFSCGKSRCIRFPHYNNDLSEEIGSYWITQKYNEDLGFQILMGNGGLSIRDCDLMMKICLGETSKSNENEDIFFSRFIRKYSKNIPKINDARRFSIEAEFSNSIGFHGSYFYLDACELSTIYDRHIRNIIGLVSKF